MMKAAMKIMKSKAKHPHRRPVVRMLLIISAVTAALATISTILFGKKMAKR